MMNKNCTKLFKFRTCKKCRALHETYNFGLYMEYHTNVKMYRVQETFAS